MNSMDDSTTPWVPPAEVWRQEWAAAADPYYEDPYNPDPYAKM